MSRYLVILLFFIISLAVFSQQLPQSNDHPHYCKFKPQDDDLPSYAYRNDWQSDLVHNYDVKFYFLDLEVTNTGVYLDGQVTIEALSTVSLLDTFAFELVPDLIIDEIVINGVGYANYVQEGDNVLVPIISIGQDEPLTAVISYHGTPPSGGFFSGISHATSGSWGKEVTWTLSEPFNAKQWWPCKQVLTDKADSSWFFLTVTDNLMAGSNGLLTDVVDLGNNRLRYEWKSKYPIAYYLISFAVSEYMDYSIYSHPEGLDGDSLLIQNFIYDNPSCLAYWKNGIDNTASVIDTLSSLYIAYPFIGEKYGHCLTELGGGMEHQTMTTMGGFSFHLVAHEAGHMWFGDHVTCATWSDIWINEGFATYSDYLCNERILGWSAAQNFIINTQANVMSSPGGSVYVPEEDATPDNVWRIFSGRLSYDKGAAIIHVLRHEINNDEVFFDILKTFQLAYADSTATGDDFRAVAEEVSGMDLETFFEQWYYGEGYPEYEYYWYSNAGVLYLTADQQGSSPVTPFFEMAMSYRLSFEDNTDTLIRLIHTENVQSFELDLGKEVVDIDVDPDNWTFERVNGMVVSVQESQNPAFFSVGPIPAHEEMHLHFRESSTGSNRAIDLIDLTGKVVASYTSRTSSFTLGVEDYRPGIYFLRVIFEGQAYTRKVLIQ